MSKGYCLYKGKMMRAEKNGISKGYCLYKGKTLRAEKDGDSIRIITEHEMPELEKITDEHGRETWRGCVPADECDDYWEASMWANINGEMVDIRLSSEGNWIISTSDEKTAHKLNMIGKDHSREMTATEMLGCLFEIRYRHIDSSLDEDIKADVWNFLRIVDSLPDRETANHLAYRQVITTVLQGRYGMPERDAARTSRSIRGRGDSHTLSGIPEQYQRRFLRT